MNKFLKAMFCVTFFSVATRALGFLLKIYLSRKLSNELLGSYQVAMSVFGVLMTLVSSGIPVVLSRNVSYYHGKQNKTAIGSIVSSGLILTSLICAIVSALILFFPNLTNVLFTSTASVEMIYILLPALVFSSIYEVLRGALWGQQQFFAISFTEFFEQIVRIIIIVILFETSMVGISQTNKTALSLSLACVLSSILVIAIYFKNKGTLANPKHELKKLIKTSTPITTVRTISSLMVSIISIIIPIKLMDFGYTSSQALSQYGIVMGMTFPLLMIPSTLISSLAVTIIPSISEQSNDIDSGNLKNTSVLKSKVNFAVRTAIVFSMILIPTFISLGQPLCLFVFNNSQAGIYLSCATICMLPLGISQITSSILNAIGLEMKSLKHYAISSSLLVLCILFLPKYLGTYALIVGYLMMSLSTTIFNISMLKKRDLIDIHFTKTIGLMCVVSFISSLLSYFVFNLLSFHFVFALIVSATISIASTCTLILTFNIANFKMVVMSKFKFLRKRHL